MIATDDIITTQISNFWFGIKKTYQLEPQDVSRQQLHRDYKGIASNQDTDKIATNTSNLQLTSRGRVQLESSLQGHLKALALN